MQRQNIDEKYLKSTAERLVNLRKALNLSKEDMAYDYAVSIATWSRFETGKTPIYPDILAKLKVNYNFINDYPIKEKISIGERFVKVRQLMNLSYAEMADKLGINPETYYGIEKDKRMSLPTCMLENMAKLNINMNWIFTGKGNILNDKSN